MSSSTANPTAPTIAARRGPTSSRPAVDDRQSWARLGLMITVHAGLAALGFAVDRWYVWLAIWAIQIVNMLGLVAMVHECVHHHFVTPRLANRVIATVASAFIFTNYEVYRSRHIGHHADTCGPSDTEGEPYTFTSRWQIVTAFLGGGVAYILSLPMLGFWVSAGASPKWISGARARRRIRINQVVWVATMALIIGLCLVDLRATAFVWLIPAAAFLTGPFVFVLMPEHYDAPGPGVVTSNTRTCVSNPVMRFVFLNTNLHTAHHDRPAVPWTGLPARHDEIAATIDEEWVFSGYLAFYRFMWRNIARPAAAA